MQQENIRLTEEFTRSYYIKGLPANRVWVYVTEFFDQNAVNDFVRGFGIRHGLARGDDTLLSLFMCDLSRSSNDMLDQFVRKAQRNHHVQGVVAEHDGKYYVLLKKTGFYIGDLFDGKEIYTLARKFKPELASANI